MDDASKLKDIARNTIVVDAKDIDNVVKELKAAGANIYRFDPVKNPSGYSGVNATIKTNSGLIAEIQVNSPKMIFAKEKPEIARALLGDAVYDDISVKIGGVPGGRGHEIYELYRSLPDGHPQRSSLLAESKAYYDLFR
jgi:hypothetical protein